MWNTSLAFFQVALLAGYGYAHALQRLRSLQRPGGGARRGAARWPRLALPLRINELLGAAVLEPSDALAAGRAGGLDRRAVRGALGHRAPGAGLARAHARRRATAREPYVLYAASNLGSLLALLAYPLLVEPALTLHAQRCGWSGGYVGLHRC